MGSSALSAPSPLPTGLPLLEPTSTLGAATARLVVRCIPVPAPVRERPWARDRGSGRQRGGRRAPEGPRPGRSGTGRREKKKVRVVAPRTRPTDPRRCGARRRPCVRRARARSADRTPTRPGRGCAVVTRCCTSSWRRSISARPRDTNMSTNCGAVSFKKRPTPIGAYSSSSSVRSIRSGFSVMAVRSILARRPSWRPRDRRSSTRPTCSRARVRSLGTCAGVVRTTTSATATARPAIARLIQVAHSP